MNVAELRLGTINRVRLTTNEWGRVAEGRTGIQCQLGGSWQQGRGLLGIQGTPITVEAASPSDEVVLSDLCQRNLSTICWLLTATAGAAQSTELYLQVHEFPTRHAWPGPLPLVIDERIVAEVQRRFFVRSASPNEIGAWLSEQCLLAPAQPGDSPRAFVSVGPTALQGRAQPFRMHGVRVAVDLRPEADGTLRVQRVVEARSSKGQPAIGRVELVEGDFSFVDRTAATIVREELLGQLEILIARADSLLRLWGDYNSLEERLLWERRARCGALRYGKRQHQDGRVWRFVLAETGLDDRLRASEALSDGSVDTLEAALEVPEDLISSGEPLDEELDAPATGPPGKSEGAFLGKIGAVEWTRGYVELAALSEHEPPPPTEGYLFVSGRGDRLRLQRRERARASIVAGGNPIPQLGLILEGRPAPSAVHRRHVAWSPAARRALGGEPTPQQTRAMDVALNTPDIALIQGPPGTGKTRLIAALQVRLAELAEEGRTASGHILLTSYQHDAVEHAAEATTVYGLPAVKVGHRLERAQHRDAIEVWRRLRLARVKEKLAELGGPPITAALRRILELQLVYAEAPGGTSNAAHVLQEALASAGGWISAGLRERIRVHADHLLRPSSVAQDPNWVERRRVERLLRAVRVNASGHADDGPLVLGMVSHSLRAAGMLSPAAQELIERSRISPDPDFANLALWRDRLLDAALEHRVLQELSVSDAITETLLAEAIEELRENAQGSEPGVTDVLDDFARTLETDLDGVKRAILRHTPILAATCQQAGGRSMREVVESAGGGRNGVEFETVVVDEAARANPLDLFIPMSMARRRVILVGDHRQLPHILEPEVERALAAEGGEVQAVFRQSLFELMFEDRLPRQTQKDGIPRVVTLDTQYRMHPVLGDFVSSAFYGGKLRSGRDASEFGHSFESLVGKVALWVDVPARSPVAEEQRGTSKARPVEADALAERLEWLMRQDSTQELTFGVITFYRAQEEAIWRALVARGMAERQEGGRYQAGARWNECSVTGHERLRIGTVDSFQGKEFDVVLLSMTRSNRLPGTNAEQLRRKYGHVALSNRLCVSLSRQRRLLVVVGDRAMLAAEGADTAIPALITFEVLCKGPYGSCQ